MNIDFSLIYAFSSEVVVHLLHGNSLVIDVRLGIHEETVGFPGYCLQQGGTPTTRPSKNNLIDLESALLGIEFSMYQTLPVN
jgi:hypothetical protein